MPKISEEKKKRISEQIVSVLLDSFPSSVFTAHIARELARDEEFTKSLLANLVQKGLVIPVTKNSSGEEYSRRIRWRLSNEAHMTYSGSLDNKSL
ncbi:hypothetical protein J4463_00240 [Candidatus Pacearchaeota archaeon]|nr:hypothetical protein [Candidatus Pacearchaeota archaeon]